MLEEAGHDFCMQLEGLTLLQPILISFACKQYKDEPFMIIPSLKELLAAFSLSFVDVGFFLRKCVF